MGRDATMSRPKRFRDSTDPEHVSNEQRGAGNMPLPEVRDTGKAPVMAL
jgi:hypothetical protein